MNEGEIKTKSILKRILSIMIINIMLVSLFAPYSIVFAESDTNTETGDVKLNLITDATSVVEGNQIVVNVQLSEVANAINVLNVNLVYDREVLEVVYDEDDGDYLVKGRQQWNAVYTPIPNDSDSIMLTRDTTFDTLDKNIVTITFNVLKTVENTVVEIEGIEASGGAGNNLSVANKQLEIGQVVQKHTVTYNYTENGNEGTTSNAPTTSVEVAENAQLDLSPTANKEGYEFVGWNTDKDATIGLTAEEAIMGTEDVELFAIFRKTITATCKYIGYDENGDIIQKEVNPAITKTIYNKETQATITLPQLEDIEDYTYASGAKTWNEIGWSTETEATTTNIITEDTITEDTTYYMVYEKDIEIIYDANGGENAPETSEEPTARVNSSNITNIEGSQVTIETQTPTKAGYEFQNAWTTNNDGTGDSYTSGETYTFTDDAILYAKWNANTYTIKYNGNENDDENTAMPDTTYIYENNESTGAKLSANTYTKAGYSFKGWATTPDATEKEYEDEDLMPNEDIIANSNNDKEITLYAVWGTSPDTPYKVEHYRQNTDGTYPTTPNETETLAGTTDTQAKAIPKTTAEYIGYVVDEDYADTQKTGIITADGNLVLKLYYKIAEYTVDFNVNGGNALPENQRTKTVKYGQTYGDMPEPTKEGHTFLGWFDDPTDGNEITSTDIVTQTKNHTLYAHWDIKTYTVDFIGKVNDGSPEGIDGIIKTVQVQHGNNINPTQLGINVEELKQTVVTPKYTYTVNTSKPFVEDLTTTITQNTQIHVNYIATINKYTVTFYNEGADPTIDTPLATEEVDYGTTATGSEANPVKQEDNEYRYQFLNWTKADGTVDDLSNVIADRNVYASYTRNT